MFFEIKYADELSTGIILNDDGTITFYDAKAVEGKFAFSSPIQDYNGFIIVLNCLHSKYPKIFDIVYNHIQNREELEYQNIREYCKTNNTYTHKLTY